MKFGMRGRGPRRLAGLARMPALAVLAPLAMMPVLAACTPEAPPLADPGSDQALAATAQQARAAIEAYAAAISALDLDSAGTFYADADFQWVEDGAIRYRSAGESRASLAALGAMASSAALTISDLSVTPLGPDAAVATCHFAQEIGMGDRGSFSFSGAMTIVLRKEAGRWLFASGHTSSVRSESERP